MSLLSHDTQSTGATQGVYQNEADWQRLLQRLPKGWQEQAITLKAWQRTRKLARVGDLLRALLVYAACGYSFRQLGLWATLVGMGCLSERAWRKRVERAQEWIGWLMGALIGSQTSPGWLPRIAGRILLVDASRLKVPAGSGEDVRMHCAYDLQAGRLVQVEVTDRHGAEGLHHFGLGKGDVVVTDAGYQLGACVKQTQAQGACGVHRVSTYQVRLEREDGHKIDLKRLVKHQRYGTVTEYRVWVWDSQHHERYAIRLIISLLPRKPAMQARARKRKRLQSKKGSQANLAPAWWAGVMVLATTLPKESWPTQTVVKLYRVRWQIELFFKRLKQGLDLHLLPVKAWERAQGYVHLCLLVWALQEQEARALSDLLGGLLREPEVNPVQEPAEREQDEPTWVISHGGLARCELETLRVLLLGSWTRQRIRDCLPDVRRYLVSHQRPKRLSQETEVQAWLLQRLGTLEKEVTVA
jgi:Transposase DDE domain